MRGACSSTPATPLPRIPISHRTMESGAPSLNMGFEDRSIAPLYYVSETCSTLCRFPFRRAGSRSYQDFTRGAPPKAQKAHRRRQGQSCPKPLTASGPAQHNGNLLLLPDVAQLSRFMAAYPFKQVQPTFASQYLQGGVASLTRQLVDEALGHRRKDPHQTTSSSAQSLA